MKLPKEVPLLFCPITGQTARETLVSGHDGRSAGTQVRTAVPSPRG